MNLEEQLLSMKRKLTALAQKRDRAKMEREILEKRLKDEFGLNSVEEADVELSRLTAQAETMEQEIEKSLREILEKYKPLLDMG